MSKTVHYQYESCIYCGHCHLYHIEKSYKRYYCDCSRQYLLISDPRQTFGRSCEHFVQNRKTADIVKLNICNQLQEIFLGEDLDDKGYYRFDTHTEGQRKEKIVIHQHIQKILNHIAVMESDAYIIRAKDMVDSYFQIAAYGIHRIAEIETS